MAAAVPMITVATGPGAEASGKDGAANHGRTQQEGGGKSSRLERTNSIAESPMVVRQGPAAARLEGRPSIIWLRAGGFRCRVATLDTCQTGLLLMQHLPPERP